MVTSVYLDHRSSHHDIKEFGGKHDTFTIRRLEAHGWEFMGYAERRLFNADGSEVESSGGVTDEPWVSLP